MISHSSLGSETAAATYECGGGLAINIDLKVKRIGRSEKATVSLEGQNSSVLKNCTYNAGCKSTWTVATVMGWLQPNAMNMKTITHIAPRDTRDCPLQPSQHRRTSPS